MHRNSQKSKDGFITFGCHYVSFTSNINTCHNLIRNFTCNILLSRVSETPETKQRFRADLHEVTYEGYAIFNRNDFRLYVLQNERISEILEKGKEIAVIVYYLC